MGKSIRNLSTVTRVGLDLAKRVFQVHAVDAKGEIVVARKLTRSQLIPFFAELPPCVVAMEACSSSENYCHNPRGMGYKKAVSHQSPSEAVASLPKISP
jgi:transposase